MRPDTRPVLNAGKSAVPAMALLAALVLPTAGCGTGLAIEREPLTGPYVLAGPNGNFQIHATVTNFGKTGSAPALLKVGKSYSVATGNDTLHCPPLLNGCEPALCEVPALDPNASKSFVLPVLGDLCDRDHCCRGRVTLRLYDAAGSKRLKGDDTDLQVTFEGAGDLSDVRVLLPDDPDYQDIGICGEGMVPGAHQ